MKASSGSLAWTALAVGVAAYDTWALVKEGTTMSTAFRNGAGHPVWKWVVIGGWGVTTCHLFNLIPRYLDPYHGYGAVLTYLSRVKNASHEILDRPN